MFRYHLLGLLRNGTDHGYGLAKEYRSRGGVDSGLGSFYRELQKLVDQGLVRRIPNPDGVDPRRAPYEITERGREAFDRWIEAIPRATHCPDSELGVRALFFGEVEPEVAERILSAWESSLWDLTKELERTLNVSAPAADRTSGVHRALLTRRLQHVAKDLDLVEELRAVLSLPETEVASPSPVERAEPFATRKRGAVGGA